MHSTVKYAEKIEGKRKKKTSEKGIPIWRLPYMYAVETALWAEHVSLIKDSDLMHQF